MTPTQTMNDLSGEILYTIDSGIQFDPPATKRFPSFDDPCLVLVCVFVENIRNKGHNIHTSYWSVLVIKFI